MKKQVNKYIYLHLCSDYLFASLTSERNGGQASMHSSEYNELREGNSNDLGLVDARELD